MVTGAWFNIEKEYNRIYFRTDHERSRTEHHNLLFITRERFGFCVWLANMMYSMYGTYQTTPNSQTTLLAIFDTYSGCPKAVHYIQNYKF